MPNLKFLIVFIPIQKIILQFLIKKKNHLKIARDEKMINSL